jgi:hypothetical protein
MTMTWLRRTRWSAAAAVTAAALAGGTAFAYWSAGGSGAGAAANGTLQTVTIDALVAGDTADGTLVPGGSADVVLRVHNPNTASVEIYSVTPNGTVTADAGHAGCTGVTFTAPASPTGITVAADSTQLVHLANAASMSLSSPSACQGATFHIPVTLTVRR